MFSNEDTLFRPTAPAIRPIQPAFIHNTPLIPRSATPSLSHKGEQVVDYDGLSARLIGASVVDSWDSHDRLLIGIEPASRLAFYSDDFSMQILAYDLDQGTWIEDDPDFPRFIMEESLDEHGALQLVIIDLDGGEHRLVEAINTAAIARLSA
jgi:hypothetical protein